jgi:ubiquinone/menaquinone biosynthesis C-methylase UbiE
MTWRMPMLLSSVHVCDLPAVISEISRVLKPGGVFCYDTISMSARPMPPG